MSHRFSAVLGCLGLLFFGSQVQADIIFQAQLTHDQEVVSPPIPNEGSSGIAIFVLNDAQTRLTYDVHLFGLDLGLVRKSPNGLVNSADAGTTANTTDDVLRGHIHRANAGVNGGIVFGFIDGSVALLNDQNDLSVNKVGLHITGAWDLSEGNPSGPGAPSTLATELPFLFSGG